MVNKITLSKIEKIIDINFGLDRNFMFVVNDVLADFIAQYLEDRFGIIDEVFSDYKGDIDEYYVSVLFNGSEPEVFYEQARGSNGKYKYSDLSECVYYIYNETDMCEITAEKVLGGEGCVLFWFEIEMEDEYEEYEYCDCEGCEYCCECEEIDDSTEEEFRILVEAVENILDVTPCSDCILKIVAELAYRFKEIGWTDHQDFIRTINED